MPLFEVETIYTEELHMAFNWELTKRKKLIWIVLLIVEFCFLGCAMLFYIGSEGGIGTFWLVFAFLYPVIILGIRRWQYRRLYRKNPIYLNRKHRLLFYEEWLEVKDEKMQSRYDYGDFLTLLEDKKGFYLMLGENTAIVIDKTKCNRELEQFIRQIVQ